MRRAPEAPSPAPGQLLGVQLKRAAAGGRPAGGQLTITYYLGLDYPAAVRRGFLGDNFAFRCACARCCAEARTPSPASPPPPSLRSGGRTATGRRCEMGVAVRYGWVQCECGGATWMWRCNMSAVCNRGVAAGRKGK